MKKILDNYCFWKKNIRFLDNKVGITYENVFSGNLFTCFIKEKDNLKSLKELFKQEYRSSFEFSWKAFYINMKYKLFKI